MTTTTSEYDPADPGGGDRGDAAEYDPASPQIIPRVPSTEYDAQYSDGTEGTAMDDGEGPPYDVDAPIVSRDCSWCYPSGFYFCVSPSFWPVKAPDMA